MAVRSVMGKEHKFKEMKVDILKLKYYKDNPRVHHVIHSLGKNPTQNDIEKAMWNDYTKELYWDIKQNGLQDPILISENYYAMEGNSRLCAFRYLYRHAKDKKDKKEMARWRKIQCEMYPPGLDKLGMHYMLGTWHIKQKKDWDAFEKASYIQRLMKEFNKTEQEISDTLKIKLSDIKKMLWCKELMTVEKVSNIKQYSHFEQAYQKPELRKKINSDEDFKKKFVKIVKSGNMGRAENIRKLPKIIKKKKDGLELLENGTDFDKVYAKALEENPDDHPLIREFEKVIKKIDKLNTVEFLEEIKSDKDKKKLIKEFLTKVENLKKILKKKKVI